MRFAGKTVVITGASMGIGAAIAEAFAAEGANLVLAARSLELLEQVAAGLPAGTGKVLTIRADVTSDEDIERLARESLSLTGRIDVLVNNAGIGMNGAVADLDLEGWRRCLEVNLLGAVRAIQAFLPGMRAAGGGTVVQISSVLGKFSAPYTAGYNASKHGLNAVSDCLRVEEAKHGIRVVSVYPGSTESNFRSNSLGAADVRKVRPGRVPAIAVGRKVVDAVARGRRDVYITFRDAALCWLGAQLPSLADWALMRLYRAQ